MRSTMTLYFAGSSMRVPPSFTNSAVTPSFAPKVLTRSINAGGKLNSRPHNSPTFFIVLAPEQNLQIILTFLSRLVVELRVNLERSQLRSSKINLQRGPMSLTASLRRESHSPGVAPPPSGRRSPDTRATAAPH